MPVSVRPATKVLVFQWPCGMPALSRSPLGARPRRRAMLVEAPFGGKSRVHPRFLSRLTVDEHQPCGIEIDLAVEPVLAPLQDVRANLLGRVRGLFLNVRPARSRKVHSVARLAATPRSKARRSSISLIVMSGVAVTRPRM